MVNLVSGGFSVEHRELPCFVNEILVAVLVLTRNHFALRLDPCKCVMLLKKAFGKKFSSRNMVLKLEAANVSEIFHVSGITHFEIVERKVFVLRLCICHSFWV